MPTHTNKRGAFIEFLMSATRAYMNATYKLYCVSHTTYTHVLYREKKRNTWKLSPWNPDRHMFEFLKKKKRLCNRKESASKLFFVTILTRWKFVKTISSYDEEVVSLAATRDYYIWLWECEKKIPIIYGHEMTLKIFSSWRNTAWALFFLSFFLFLPLEVSCSFFFLSFHVTLFLPRREPPPPPLPPTFTSLVKNLWNAISRLSRTNVEFTILFCFKVFFLIKYYTHLL